MFDAAFDTGNAGAFSVLFGGDSGSAIRDCFRPSGHRRHFQFPFGDPEAAVNKSG